MTASIATLARERAMESWAARNQQWLTARFAFWRERLGRGANEAEPVALPPDEDEASAPPAAAIQLRSLFGLTAFETQLIVLAAGVELDAALRAAVADAQGTAVRDAMLLRYSLAMALLPEPHWDAISPLGPLRHWSLLEIDASEGMTGALLRIDERVLHFVSGVGAADERLKGIARLDEQPGDADDELSLAIATAMAGTREPLVLLTNAATDGTRLRTGRLLARAVFQRGGLHTLWVDTGALAATPGEIVDLARRLDREAAMAPAGIALALEPDAAQTANAARLITSLRSPLVVLGSVSALHLADSTRQVWRFTVPPADAWRHRPLPPAVRDATRRALQQFHVDEVALDQALASVADVTDETTIDERVWDALREAARGGLEALAQRIESRTTFDDLVVPSPVAAQLREIASQLGQRLRVYEEWGFGERHPRGLGIAALFAGESGTGKTLAAEAIANVARLDLYRIDLASVVSKYIGETEKNLSRVFDAAERSGAVLLFDEADALFGKRSEVKDSHDRYANVEIAYLLQRIESYRGLAVLTTNMKSALDRAFLRRIRFVVQFPFPDEAARAQIWRVQFPPRAPLGTIDYPALARMQLSGGHIRSVALNAAFRAAAENKPIEQSDLMAAARAEFAKLERTLTRQPGGPVE